MKDLEDIMKGLSLLQYYVRFSSNKLGLHSINKLCEPFCGTFFNRMYGFKLKTIEKKNYPAIDLKDKKKIDTLFRLHQMVLKQN
ncbi:SMEK domain-containing protein [Paenibacillus rhizoplanae]